MIRLIKAHMQVMEVGGDQDYRSHCTAGSHQRFTQGHYLWPGSTLQRQAVNLPQGTQAVRLEVGQRHLHALFSQARTVSFNFDALCEQEGIVIHERLAFDEDKVIVDEPNFLASVALYRLGRAGG